MMLKQESAQTPALCPCLCPPLINSIEFVLHVCVVVIGDVDFLLHSFPTMSGKSPVIKVMIHTNISYLKYY